MHDEWQKWKKDIKKEWEKIATAERLKLIFIIYILISIAACILFGENNNRAISLSTIFGGCIGYTIGIGKNKE